MKKVLICWLLFLVVVGLSLPVSAEERAQIAVQTSIAGGRLSAAVVAKLPEAVEAAGIEFTLNYNPDELELKGVRPGAMLAGKNALIRASVDHANGSVHCSAVVLVEEQALYGGGTVFELHFLPKQAGSSTLAFAEEGVILGAWGGSRIECLWSGAEITVADGDAPPAIDANLYFSSVTDNVQYTGSKVRVRRLVAIGEEQIGELLQQNDGAGPVRLTLLETAALQEYYGTSAAMVSALQIPEEALQLLAGRGLVVTAPDGSRLSLEPEALQSALERGELIVEHSSVSAAAAQELVGSQSQAVCAVDWRWNMGCPATIWLPLRPHLSGRDSGVYAVYKDGAKESMVPAQVSGSDSNYVEVTVDKPGTFVLCEAHSVKKLILQVGTRKMIVNGQVRWLDAAPYIDPDASRTMVPVRFISEGLGAQVDWLPSTCQVRITDGGTEVLLTIDSVTVLVGGQELEIDCPPVIQGNRTFVPLRFVSEVLGAQVEYEVGIKRITIVR